jgi:metallo-beta-lactamase family protein
VPSRIDRQKVAQLDWHNDASRLILDINDALTAATDEKARGVVIRRLRRALNEVVPPVPPAN